MRLPFWFHEFKSWIKHHPNRLHIKTLKRGWVDCDEQLLHASMQILVNFVEKEKRGGYVDWDFDSQHRNAAAEMERLYSWWKHDPFAQDAGIMPETEKWINPYAHISCWLDSLYRNNEYKPDLSWAKDIVARCWESEPIDGHNSKSCYYRCLAFIQDAAVNRQDKALKDLISIRSYLWT